MNQTAFVLVVEDEEAQARAIADAIKPSNHACNVVAGGAAAIESIKIRPPDVVITSFGLDGAIDGLDVLRETKRISPDTEVILLAGEAQVERAREALSPQAKYRAYDVQAKPIKPADGDLLRDKVNRAAQRAIAARQTRALREQVDKGYDYDGIIGISDRLRREIKRALKLARSKSTVLISGETGTGKELFAQAIHANSPRTAKPFKVLNCAAVSETLLESELFGHVKGAFTGAVADRKGLLHAADGGTVFLDEIGDMPLTMQAKLLRTLENGEVIPVGSNDTVHLDIRFVAATNHDLSDLVREGKFRDDLFYRLHAHGAIHIPPLRDRREDIPILVTRFIAMSNQENGLDIEGITPDALRKLIAHDWPGNVRELRNVVDRMCVETEQTMLEMADLPDTFKGVTDIVAVGPLNWTGLSLPDVERLHIINTLRLFGGNREKTAKALKIGARTLYRKLKEYGIT